MTGHADNAALQAADPGLNATVHASAGTGKTWLLVTRIIRLLLDGARPESILAVTFTRKAAAEMQQRVSERLHELMAADATRLDDLLLQCGITPTSALRGQARCLYETNLFNPYALRATTFHAFCQELLQRFPMEADVTPGFQIAESTGLLEREAWDALFAEATRAPDGPLAQALDQLIERCNGLANTRTALVSFLRHRSDWWAYIQGEANPADSAAKKLAGLLDCTVHDDPLDGFPNAELRTRLQQFTRLLERNTTATNTTHAGLLASALATPMAAAAFLDTIRPVFFTRSGEPRARKAGATQRKRLGEQHETLFIELHTQLAAELLMLQDRIARTNTLRTTLAWYTAGMQLLEHFQRIKQEQRLLDFADLEWQACELLNRGEHASWIQYKLDARIDHLLVDEFQDTNPTQWRLLLPLLEELAAGGDERQRSVFLVGDVKQSIYSFRRAKPALLGAAAHWLEDRLGAEHFSLDASRRSATAIMDCVNAVFGSPPLDQRLSGFNPHSTHHPDMHGRVEVLPLVTGTRDAAESASVTTGLRNPLQTPRGNTADPRYYLEGTQIADRIQELISNRTVVVRDAVRRTATYGDIMILLRTRTHAADFEKALRDNGIPYLSAGKSVLLDNLEIRDLEALLNLLIAPYDNLALAQVLRAPLFGFATEALLPLARLQTGTWYERLATFTDTDSPLGVAYRTLENWRRLAGQVPVHDLLDRIYHQAAVMERYTAAFPAPLVARVRANLTRFIELALEVDNGRYPSLPRFLDQLGRLRQAEQDQPEEATPQDTDNDRVRLLTIHGAKGLEAPVVFLADTATPVTARNAYAALVNWPVTRDRPAHFLLTASKSDQDSRSRELLDKQQQENLHEDANLLYVAITRARQYLYISGNTAGTAPTGGWYGNISTALQHWQRSTTGSLTHTTGTPACAATVTPAAATSPVVDKRLSQPLVVTPAFRQIAPSHTVQTDTGVEGEPDGRERGIAIHHMLEQLAGGTVTETGVLPATIAQALNRATDDSDMLAWWQEAVQTFRSPECAHLFDATRYDRAFSEVPIEYLDGKHMVYGIIDRLVLCAGTVWVIDFKTHTSASRETLATLAAAYREQMQLYARGVRLLWPRQLIRPCLLFTACNALVPMDEPD
ncbi:MAG: UvrD-helicase domain-containing protein [Gammaproteobacteria bacterium]